MASSMKELIESMIRESLSGKQLDEFTRPPRNSGRGGGDDGNDDGDGHDDDEDGPYYRGMNFGQYQDSFTHHAVHINDRSIRHALVKEMGVHVRKFTAAIDKEDMRGARAGLAGMKKVHDEALSHSSVKVPLHKLHDDAWMGANGIEKGDPKLFDDDTIHIKQK